MNLARLSLVLSVVLLSSSALAQQEGDVIIVDDNGVDPNANPNDPNAQPVYDPQQPQQQYQQPQQQQQYQQPQQQPQQQQQFDARQPQQERGARQVSVMIGPSIPLGVDEFGIGGEFRARFGWEFGWVVPHATVGYRFGRFSAVLLGLGARLQIVNESRFLPYVGAGLNLHFWSLNGSLADDITFGIDIQGGVGIELSPNWGLDVGAKISLNFVSSAFADVSFLPYLTPHVGVTYFF